MRRIAVVAFAFVVTSCLGREPSSGVLPPVRLPELPAPDIACPGGPSCSETLVDDVLLVGAAVGRTSRNAMSSGDRAASITTPGRGSAVVTSGVVFVVAACQPTMAREKQSITNGT